MNIKLAEALLRRKELQGKVAQLASIQDRAMFDVRTTRVKVAENVDDLILSVPLLSASQVTSEHDWHARQLRLVDAAIQQANWTTEIDVQPSVMDDYTAPEQTRTKV